MPASVTVEGGGSGSDLDCFSDASLDHLLSRSTILIFWESTLCLLHPIWGQSGDESFLVFFESLFEDSFHFADVTGFTVLACQLVYYSTFVRGWSLCFGSTRMLMMVVWGLTWSATYVFLIRREMGSVTPPI